MLVVPRTGLAAPIVSLDLDPTRPGIQAERSLPGPGEFQVDVVVLGVDSPPLAGYELELGFAPGVLAFSAASSGGFLDDPFFFDVLPGAASVRVDSSIRTFGGGPTGDGVLASLFFDALAPGASLLELDAVL